MYKYGYKKKFSKNIKVDGIQYKFGLLENESNPSEKLLMVVESIRKKKNWFSDVYQMDVKCEKINQKLFYEFADHYAFNGDVRKSFSDKELDVFNLPKKTMAHISYRSNGLNIKKANNGEDDKLKNLRIWNDELSYLKEEDLESVLSENEIVLIINGVKGFVKNKKRQEELIRSALRWCIRGLSAENALLKLEKEYEERLFFVKRSLLKKRFKQS